MPESTTRTTPHDALVALAAQHDHLRALMTYCEELADEIDAGRGDPAELVGEVARLRLALDSHNQLEERLLHPVLLDADWLGAVRVARMVEDHVEEHRAMRRDLETVAELRTVLSSLRAHLVSEERYFLTRKVLEERAR